MAMPIDHARILTAALAAVDDQPLYVRKLVADLIRAESAQIVAETSGAQLHPHADEVTL